MKSTINLGYLVFLSVVAALGGFLFGYDTAVISGTIAQVTEQFGLDALQQGWYVGCALIGSIIGVLFAGILSDKFGRKSTMILSAILFSTSAIGCAVSTDFNQLVIYRIIGGVGIGVVSIISPLYISEVAVAQYRGRLVSLYQLAVTIGFLGAYLVNYQLLGYSMSNPDVSTGWWNLVFVSEVWRGMLGMETLPAIMFFIIIFFIPESPRWLILKGREEKATNILERIYTSSKEALFQLTETKSVLSSESKSEWKLLLQPGIRKAVIIGVCIAVLGQFMGVNAVLYYGPSIFENAGLSGGDSLFYQVLVGLVNTLTTVLALVIIDKVGRKKLVYYGVSGMVISLVLIATIYKCCILPEDFATILIAGLVLVKTTEDVITSGYLKKALPNRITTTIIAVKVMPRRKIQAGTSPRISCTSSLLNSILLVSSDITYLILIDFLSKYSSSSSS